MTILPSQSYPFFMILALITLTALSQLILIPTFQKRSYQISFILSLLPLFLSALILIKTSTFNLPHSLITVDHLSITSIASIILFSILSILTLWKNEKQDNILPEVYPLILFSLIGAIFLVSSNNLLMIFIALETISFPVYIMVALKKNCKASIEASLKYFILGGAASATFLYGTSLIFGISSTLDLKDLAHSPFINSNLLIIIGLILIISSTIFKIGAAPFQAWVADVYQGSSLPIVSYMSSVIKFSSLIVLLRIFEVILNQEWAKYYILALATLSIIIGNLLALIQKDFKRLFAFSSIAHSGYILLAFACLSILSKSSILFYIFIYAISSIGIFAILTQLSNNNYQFPISSLRGIGFERPFLGIALTLFIFSLSGIPLTAGFIAKFYLFSSMITELPIAIIIIALLFSILSLCYYFKVVISIYSTSTNNLTKTNNNNLTNNSSYAFIVTIISFLITIAIGIYPPLSSF
ncbi:MAG: NADH-quinone oxidoreductase subunit N [Oligoflexia bacterium]|nr:NADH-quinone oxidoreductase subunit N [Oligoflexia bacterium]